MELALQLRPSPQRVIRRSYGSHTARPLLFITRAPILCPSDMSSPRHTNRRLEMRQALKSLARKKTLFALVLALTIFGAVYGFAATLNVGTNQLSAGNASVASCQASGTPTGTYTVAYDSTLSGYSVSGVTVTGIDANCHGKTPSATLTGT